MKKRVTVGYKFCGNCNPYIDTKHLLRDLERKMNLDADFVFWRNSTFDILLIISACLTDCAERPPFSGPVIVVAADTINHIPIKEENLIDELAQQIKKNISQS